MRMNRLMCFLLLVVMMLGGRVAHATTYFVAPCGSNAWAGVNVNCIAPLGPKRTIQAAINVAANGDTVMVMPGTYFENIDFNGKEITVKGAAGAATTIIDGGGAGPVVLCNSFEGPGTTLQGLTIRNGYADTINGAGMVIALATVNIADCIFEDNFADTGVGGGGVAASSSTTTFSNCRFEGNTGFSAGGLLIWGGTTTVTDCDFDDNDGMNQGGGMMVYQANADITDCTFTNGYVGFLDAQGAGLYIGENSNVTMNGCTIADNTPFRGTAGIAIHDSTLSLVSCDFTNNHATSIQARGNALDTHNSTITMLGCNFTGNHGGDIGGGAVYAADSSITATWCGFLNNATSPGVGWGGAIFLIGSSLDAGLCTFGGNSCGCAGGAIFGAASSTVDLEGCTFSNNTATDGVYADGGAIRLAQGGSLSAFSCTFTGNTAASGGGVWMDDVLTSTFGSCSFENNIAMSGNGGGIRAVGTPVLIGGSGSTFSGNQSWGSGGGIYFESSSDYLSMSLTEFTANTASTAGGAVRADGDTLITACGFFGNASHDAGALAIVGPFGDARIYSCRFDGNQAVQAGGAIMNGAFSAGSEVLMLNSIVSNNTSGFGFGAIYESALGAFTHIVNCAVVDNAGGGITIDNGATQSIVANTVLWGNTAGDDLDGLMPEVMFCNIQDGGMGIAPMNADPMFINAAAGNYHLSPGSPCIDAGNNWLVPTDWPNWDFDLDTAELFPMDFDNQPRFADDPAAPGCGGLAIVDIGPYEAAGNPVPAMYPGDVNADGMVNVTDLLALLSGWGACPDGCCAADLNLDGWVNVTDLLIMLTNWT